MLLHSAGQILLVTCCICWCIVEGISQRCEYQERATCVAGRRGVVMELATWRVKSETIPFNTLFWNSLSISDGILTTFHLLGQQGSCHCISFCGISRTVCVTAVPRGRVLNPWFYGISLLQHDNCSQYCRCANYRSCLLQLPALAFIFNFIWPTKHTAV